MSLVLKTTCYLDHSPTLALTTEPFILGRIKTNESSEMLTVRTNIQSVMPAVRWVNLLTETLWTALEKIQFCLRGWRLNLALENMWKYQRLLPLHR